MRKQESSCSACNGDLRDKTRIRVPLDGHLARWACIWQHNLCFILSFFFLFSLFFSGSSKHIFCSYWFMPYSHQLDLHYIFIQSVNLFVIHKHIFWFMDRRGNTPYWSIEVNCSPLPITLSFWVANNCSLLLFHVWDLGKPQLNFPPSPSLKLLGELVGACNLIWYQGFRARGLEFES